jgi:cytochrome c oxidase cbb3-type subunit 3
MRPTIRLAAAACVLALSILAGTAHAQPRGPATFPAQQRPPGDPALIERGRVLYETSCRFCHGADLRGGDGGPNLLRSRLVFNDQQGELIGPVVLGGSQTAGVGTMPAIPMPDADVRAVAEYLHSVQATMRGQGNPPPGGEVELNVLVGDAAAGRAYFDSTCSSCHAPADMSGIASRAPGPKDLQNYWLRGSMGGRGGGSQTPETVTVTMASGQQHQGELIRYDDFIVVLKQADGLRRSFRRNGAEPKVEIRDPAEAHLRLLPNYTDKNIHDVTAYLVTLK